MKVECIGKAAARRLLVDLGLVLLNTGRTGVDSDEVLIRVSASTRVNEAAIARSQINRDACLAIGHDESSELMLVDPAAGLTLNDIHRSPFPKFVIPSPGILCNPKSERSHQALMSMRESSASYRRTGNARAKRLSSAVCHGKRIMGFPFSIPRTMRRDA